MESSGSDLSWKDNLWLHAFGLSKENILEYFYTSPFFDLSSNNQAIRTQGVGVSFLTGMTGVQYVVDETNSHEPSLFVIKKIWRQDPRVVTLLGVYYCLDGVLYESPNLIDLLRSRQAKSSNHLLKAFDCLCEDRYNNAKKVSAEDQTIHLRQRLPPFDRAMKDLSNL
jgi:hypothetical protein